MDLSQEHTFPKIVFHMTKQEIEEEIGRGWDSGWLPAYPLKQGSAIQKQVIYPKPSRSVKPATR